MRRDIRRRRLRRSPRGRPSGSSSGRAGLAPARAIARSCETIAGAARHRASRFGRRVRLLGFLALPAGRAAARHRRRPDRVPADLVDRPSDRRRLPARATPASKAKVFEIVIQARRDPRGVLGISRAPRSASLRGSLREPRANRFVAQPRDRVSSGRAARARVRQARSRRTLFAPVPVAIAFVAGAFVILWVERRQRTRPDAVRIDDVDDDALARRAQGRARAGVRADSGHVAFGRHDHRRHAVRPVAPRGHRVLVLPRDPDAVRGVRLRVA